MSAASNATSVDNSDVDDSNADKSGRGRRERLRSRTGLNRCYRGCVFLAGLAVVLAGCALWLLSVLAAVPAVLAGVWLWSKDFEWGRRLLGRLKCYGLGIWQRAKRRPLRWTVITAAGFAFGATSYWLVRDTEHLGVAETPCPERSRRPRGRCARRARRTGTTRRRRCAVSCCRSWSTSRGRLQDDATLLTATARTSSRADELTVRRRAGGPLRAGGRA